jgi:hypothetical protein
VLNILFLLRPRHKAPYWPAATNRTSQPDEGCGREYATVNPKTRIRARDHWRSLPLSRLRAPKAACCRRGQGHRGTHRDQRVEDIRRFPNLPPQTRKPPAIGDGDHKVARINHETAAAADEQSTGVSQISRAIVEIQRVVKEVAAKAEEASRRDPATLQEEPRRGWKAAVSDAQRHPGGSRRRRWGNHGAGPTNQRIGIQTRTCSRGTTLPGQEYPLTTCTRLWSRTQFSTPMTLISTGAGCSGPAEGHRSGRKESAYRDYRPH